MRKTSICTVIMLAAIVVVGSAEPAGAFDFTLFKDPEDGAFDLSEWLLSRGGFLPVPIVVTEPAVGAGLGVAPVFFHGGLAGKPAPGHPERMLPPSISAAAAVYTANGTWLAGGGHFGSWKQDTIRYTGLAGLVNLNIDFYAADKPVSFNIDGVFVLQDAKFRLGGSNFFVGGRWIFFDSRSKIDRPEGGAPEFPEIGEDGLDSTNSGLGVVAYYDGRDNIFTPNTGQMAAVNLLRYDQAIGGDFDYWYLLAQALSYHRLHDRFVLGLRFKGEAVDGRAPFYGYPFVQLRGIPVMRYQGRRVLNLEVEGRWRVYKRWSLVGFVGKGFTDSDIPRFETEDDIRTVGAGFRYLIARKLKLHVGLDAAMGPEQTSVYLIVGNAWAF